MHELARCNRTDSASLGLVHKLIAAGANPSAKETTTGKSSFMLAIEKGNVELVRALINSGAKMDMKNDEPEQKWRAAAKYSGKKEMYGLVLEGTGSRKHRVLK